MNIKEEVTKSNNTYTCAICNKKHYSIEDRIACETKCLEERKKAEEVMKKHKLELEKKDRMNKIETMYEDLSNLISSYIEDYGYIKLEYRHNADCDCIPSLSRMFDFWSL